MEKRRKKKKTVIKNYGLMWSRDAVSWGHEGRKGTLEGQRKGQTIDFREQIAVYVLYDEGRRPPEEARKAKLRKLAK